MKPRTIKKALKDWHKAWDSSKAKWAWNLHHDVELEPIVGSVKDRLKHILTTKPDDEIVIRLDNFRPATLKIPKEIKQASKEYKKKLKAIFRTYDKYLRDTSDFVRWLGYTKAYEAYTDEADRYNEVVAKHELYPLHYNDVPNNSWNGKNIF